MSSGKCLGERAAGFLTKIFNIIFDGEKMPEEWRSRLKCGVGKG